MKRWRPCSGHCGGNVVERVQRLQVMMIKNFNLPEHNHCRFTWWTGQEENLQMERRNTKDDITNPLSHKSGHYWKALALGEITLGVPLLKREQFALSFMIMKRECGRRKQPAGNSKVLPNRLIVQRITSGKGLRELRQDSGGLSHNGSSAWKL